MAKKIWFIRHAESTSNVGGRTLNHEVITLTPHGEEQALNLIEKFDELPSFFITSRFTRAQQTGLPLAKKCPDYRFEIWDSINEFTYLAPATSINTTYAERKIKRDEYWERCDPNYVDGWEAESFNNLLKRARETIARLKGFDNYKPHNFIVLFTHALFMQAVEVILTSDGKEDAKSLMARFRDLPRYGNCEILKWENGIVKEKELPFFTLLWEKDEDGFIVYIKEIDILGYGNTESEAIDVLVKATMEYAELYLSDMDYYRSPAVNRAAHYPYICLIAKCKNDVELVKQLLKV